MGPQDNLIVCLAEPSWLLAEATGEDEEENFFKITTIARKRGVRIRAAIAGDWHHYARYFAARARHSFHHLGRRRRLPASDPRLEERHLGALAGAPGRGGEPVAGYDRGPTGRGLEAEAVRHPPQAQHESGRRRRRAGGPGRAGRAGAAAGPPRSHPSASASRSSHRRPNAIPRRARAICSASATSCSRSTIRASPSASVCSIGSSPGNSRRSSPATGISDGKIDDLGITTSLGEVLAYMPLYLIQAMIASISLVVMLGGLYAVLVWYVDAGRLSRPAPLPDQVLRRHRRISWRTSPPCSRSRCFVVMLDTWMTPPIERAVNAIYEVAQGAGAARQGRHRGIAQTPAASHRGATTQLDPVRREEAKAHSRDRRLHVVSRR